MARLDRFDNLIPATPWVNPWQHDGTLRVDYDLLRSLLAAAVGTSQASGTVAAAVDVWAAEELRRAGFDPDEVWPRRTSPRVLPRDVRNFVKLGLTKGLRAQVEERYSSPGAKKALPAEAHVMGSAYTKQADVVVASWSAGVELLISTKTMLSSYQKNLRNRFEEGYGDAKNLRGRHPLASLGFAFIVGRDIPDVSLEFAIDMLRKLTTEPDVYDCACLIVVEGAGGTVEEPARDERGIDEEPTALLNLPDEEELVVEVDEEASETDGVAEIALHLESAPVDLSAEHFFETLIGAALDRMPVAVYPELRRRRQLALAGSA
jgi:hypothetical protein